MARQAIHQVARAQREPGTRSGGDAARRTSIFAVSSVKARSMAATRTGKGWVGAGVGVVLAGVGP